MDTVQTNNIVYTAGEDRKGKYCYCCVCHKISKCTPSFEFYTTEDHGEGLVCEYCSYDYLHNYINNYMEIPKLR